MRKQTNKKEDGCCDNGLLVWRQGCFPFGTNPWWVRDNRLVVVVWDMLYGLVVAGGWVSKWMPGHERKNDGVNAMSGLEACQVDDALGRIE